MQFRRELMDLRVWSELKTVQFETRTRDKRQGLSDHVIRASRRSTRSTAIWANEICNISFSNCRNTEIDLD